MKRINTSGTGARIAIQVLILLSLLAVIVVAYPHKSGSFAYRIEVGRPWSHGLITAQYDFPIYKSEEQVRQEQYAALRDFSPYYIADARASQEAVRGVEAAAKTQLSSSEARALVAAVRARYEAGILSLADLQHLRAEGCTTLMVVDAHHKATAHRIADCCTPRMAYDSIVAALSNPSFAAQQEGTSASQGISSAALHRISLNTFLVPNLRFDSVTTAAKREKLLTDVTETCGIVQKGEKIIDRGEIVDANTQQILLSLKRSMEENGIDSARATWMEVGVVVLFALLIFMVAVYLQVFRPQLFADVRSLLFYCLLMGIVVVTACVVTRYTSMSIYIVPFTWVPIITRVFYDSRTAFYLHLITVLLCSFLAPVPFEFLVLQLLAGMVAVTSLRDMAQRSQLFQTTFWIFLTYVVCYTAFILAHKGSFEMLHWHIYVYFAANAALVVCAYILIYLFERVFRLVSAVTLVELTNINSDLMVEFAEKAPGSFQHSLQVSNLAMEAAKHVGANVLLVRTGALYHDIGKMSAPGNFTENQQGGHNPLSVLSYEQAAAEVIKHVAAGVAIAEQHHIPEVIISFIKMHHGTSKTRFFYNSYINAHPGEAVPEEHFAYPGPKPNSKETALVMMADAVEARSRSLQEYSEESIRQMVDQMIGLQMADGQLEETPLTFHDIQIAKQIFTKKLISMNHHRIAYPELRFDKADGEK